MVKRLCQLPTRRHYGTASIKDEHYLELVHPIEWVVYNSFSYYSPEVPGPPKTMKSCHLRPAESWASPNKMATDKSTENAIVRDFRRLSSGK